MATGGSSADFELYECQVCLELMVDKRPRMLSCHHSFCQECLGQIVEYGRICCPTCRKSTPVEDEDVRKLPMNFYIIKMWERESERVDKAPRSSSRPSCGLCTEAEATAKCEKCLIFLCSSCKIKHGKMPGYQTHTLSRLCEKHGHIISQVCMKCRELVCISCIVEGHQGHDDQLMEYQDCIAKVKDDLTQVNAKIEASKTKLLITSEGMKEKFRISDGVKREIEAKETFYREQLEKLVKIRIDIESKYDQKRADITKSLSDANEACSKNQAEVEFLRSHIDTDPDHLIKGSFDLQSRVKDTETVVNDALSWEYEVPVYNKNTLTLEESKPVQKQEDVQGNIQLIERPLNPCSINTGHETNIKGDAKQNTGQETNIKGDAKQKPRARSRNRRDRSRGGPLENIPGFGNLGWPVEVVISQSGSLLVADRELKKVFQYDQRGRQVHVYNTVPHAGDVMGLAVFKDMLYIVHNSVIAKVPLVKETQITAEFFEPAINHMCRLLVVSTNSFVISDHDAKKVYMYNPRKNTTRVVLDGLDRPTCVSMTDTPQGKRFIVTDMGAHEVSVYDDKWRHLATFGGKGVSNGLFKSPQSTLVTPDGALLVADRYNHRISEFSLDGRFRGQMLTRNDGIEYPVGLAYGHSRLWVLEYFFSPDKQKHIALRSFPLSTYC